jgi:hypothetical protein
LIEFAEQLTARQALDRWRKGELALLDSPPAQEEPAQREQRAGVPRLSLVIGKRPADEAFGDSSCAIRNHEHLQLYEGGKEKE